MTVTINDIAKAAKVSPSTVSRVIANNSRISKATTEKVLKIMKEMNYHPNIIARSLASKSTQIIGVVVPGSTEKAFQHPFFPEILRGIASVAYKNGYNILISSTSDINEEKRIIKEFAKGGITEGIVLMTSRLNDPSVSELMKLNFPFVVVGRPQKENEVNWVDNNNFSISYELTNHFISQGYKKIAFLGVSSEYTVTVDRLEGYKKALHDNNILFDNDFVVEGEFIDDTGYDLMNKLFTKEIVPEGVIACDDLLAFGVIKAISDKGLDVPGDIAVAGFNNVPLADYFMPSLTSVEVNAFNLGLKAFELLLADIKSEQKSFNRAIIPAELVIRKSSLNTALTIPKLSLQK